MTDHAQRFTFATDTGQISMVAPAAYYEIDPYYHAVKGFNPHETIRVAIYPNSDDRNAALADAGPDDLSTVVETLATGVEWTIGSSEVSIFAATAQAGNVYVVIGNTRSAASLAVFREQAFMAALLTFTVGADIDPQHVAAAQPHLQAAAEMRASRQREGLQALDFAPFAAALDSLDKARRTALDGLVLDADAAALQTAMQAGHFSGYELALYYLDRIRRHDANQLRSVIALNPDALSIAAILDAERATGTVRGPLHGIPVLLKANIATGDSMPTHAGAAALREAVTADDAYFVRQLRHAGAVILGKTNLSEWANFISEDLPNGFSALGGQVMHPVDARFDPLGSSTGSAVAVRSNFATLTVGTETMGSIIAPAAALGVVGHYPSVGLVSRDRIIPLTVHTDSAGPITRTVRDAAQLLTAMAATDANDPKSSETASLATVDFTTFLDADALRGQRVLVIRHTDDDPDGYLARYFGPDVLAAFGRAGATLVTHDGLASPEALQHFLDVLRVGLRDGSAAYLAQTAAPLPTLAEIVALNAAHADRYIPYGQNHLEAAVAATGTAAEMAAHFAEMRSANRAELQRVLTDNDAAVVVGLDNIQSWFYASANLPAITVPGGQYGSGLPRGVTFIGGPLDDGPIIGYAYAFEQAWRA